MPRGTATYTPKWSIVVLTLACLGVLKFNGFGWKTTTDRETSSAESLLPTVENKARPTGQASESVVWIPGGEFSIGSNHVKSPQEPISSSDGHKVRSEGKK